MNQYEVEMVVKYQVFAGDFQEAADKGKKLAMLESVKNNSDKPIVARVDSVRMK